MNIKIAKKSLIIIFLSLIVILVMSSNAALAIDPPPGPGGIGTDNLTAWFKADTGVFSNNDCTTAASAAGKIACWQDQSPNNLLAKQSGDGKRPTWQSNQINTMPVVRFDGANDVLGTESIASLTNSFPTSDTTVFVVQKTNDVQVQSTFGVGVTEGTNRFNANVPWSDNTVYWDMGDVSGTGDGRLSYSPFSDTSSFQIWTFSMESGTGQAIYKNGANLASDATASTFNPADRALYLGAYSKDGEYMDGEIAELVIFNSALNDMNSTKVSLYLMDKYDIDLSDVGIFSAPAAYNNQVRGISKSANVLSSGDSGGLSIIDFSFLQELDDILILGHNNGNVACCITENLGSSSANARWGKIWAFVINDEAPPAEAPNGGLIDLTFDISDAGGQGAFDEFGEYYLLKRATGTADDFVDVPVESILILGDKITFRVNVADLGSEFTLGAFNSPLAVQLQEFAPVSRQNELGLLAVVVLFSVVTLILITRRKNYKV